MTNQLLKKVTQTLKVLLKSLAWYQFSLAQGNSAYSIFWDFLSNSFTLIIANSGPNPLLGALVLKTLLFLSSSSVVLCRSLTDLVCSEFLAGKGLVGVDNAHFKKIIPNVSQKRFSIVYCLLSLTFNCRFNVKVLIGNLTQQRDFTFCSFDTLLTLSSIFNNANWLEREIWDMFGIIFINHPDLRRLLTDYNFIGHPLQKTFPLCGLVDVSYSDTSKRVVYSSVTLAQTYRHFSFVSFCCDNLF